MMESFQAAVEFFAIRIGVRWMCQVVTIVVDLIIYIPYAVLQVKGSFPSWFCGKHIDLCSKAKHLRPPGVCPIPMRCELSIRETMLDRETNMPDRVEPNTGLSDKASIYLPPSFPFPIALLN